MGNAFGDVTVTVTVTLRARHGDDRERSSSVPGNVSAALEGTFQQRFRERFSSVSCNVSARFPERRGPRSLQDSWSR